jgi:ferrous iron transport protein B
MAIFSAYILNIILKIKCKTFVVEISYKLPLFKNVLNVIENKSICFWCRKNNFSYINRAIYGFLWSWGKFNNAETIQFSKTENAGIPQEELDNKVAAYKLENSYIGIMGKV